MSCCPPAPVFDRAKKEERACLSSDWIFTAPSPKQWHGRVDMRRDLLAGFAAKLSPNDVGVIEATGKRDVRCSCGCAACEEGGDRQAETGVYRCLCQDQNDDRRRRSCAALCQRLLARSLDFGRADAGSASTGDTAQSDCPTGISIEERHPVDPS